MDLSAQEALKRSGIVKPIHTPARSLKSIGQACLTSATLKRSNGPKSKDRTLSRAAFPARTLATQEKGPGSPGKRAASGSNTPKRLGYYDLDTSLLRTYQHSLTEGLTLCLLILPRAGIMLNGIVYRLKPSAHPIEEIGSSLLPTPQASDHITKRTSKSWKAKRGFRFQML